MSTNPTENGDRVAVLAVCESPLLPTGLGTYGREVLARLSACEDLSITALITDADRDDPALLDLPYRVVVAEVDDDPASRFGSSSFAAAALKARPQVVLSWRDWLQDQFIFRHAYRRLYRHVWASTHDASPRPRQEAADAASCDVLLGYTQWGLDEMRGACGPTLRVGGVAAPAADYEIFRPLPDEAAAVRRRFGLENRTVFGTVQRNQFRKMLPELIYGFAEYGGEAAVLWLHTTLPDSAGFDLALHLRDAGMLSRCLLTYHCHACREWWPSPYQGVAVPCRCCVHGTATPMRPETNGGLAPKELALLMNCFDVYCHFATNEGFGMPLLEAAACGRFLCGVDHTATAELLSVLGVSKDLRTTPALRVEQGSERWLASLDPAAIAATLRVAAEYSPERRTVLGTEYAARARAAYSYDKAAQVWIEAIHTCAATGPLPRWDSPAAASPPVPDRPGDDEVDAYEYAELAYSFSHPFERQQVLESAQLISDGRLTREALWDSRLKAGNEYRRLEALRLREASGVKVRPALGSLS